MTNQYTLQERIINFAQDAAQYWKKERINEWYCHKHKTFFRITDEPCWQCYNENKLYEIIE
ncbi:MAG: hypothetical protein ACOCP4_00665 [Candidatus Woesearchaeota archaeon]